MVLERLVAYLSEQGIGMRRSRISEILLDEGLRSCSWTSCAELLGREPLQAPGEDRDEGDFDERDEVLLRPFDDGVQSPVAADPAERALNGLITNDKFCLTRTGQLQLSLSHVRGRGWEAVVSYLCGEVTHRGGKDAAARAVSLERSAHRCDDANQSAAMGPGLSTPSAVGDDRTGAGNDVGAPDPAGGVSCV